MFQWSEKIKRKHSMIHLPHDVLVYPPKMYFPTRIMVTVGPLLSHFEWKVVPAQPSTDARQQRAQYEGWLCTRFNQIFKVRR